MTTAQNTPMIDPFGRQVTYLRVSVTDRCDFRCVYCMSEKMTFLPKTDVLSLEELYRISASFIKKGVRKIRLTGGEPLVRRDVMWLVEELGKFREQGLLDELTLTTNGSQLPRFAEQLYAAGVRRINVSIDTLDADKFKAITRWGRFDQVMEGLQAAKKAGLAVKINTVALRNVNDDEIHKLVAWCGEEGFDLTFIETMPMGAIEPDRFENYFPLSALRKQLEQQWSLEDIDFNSGGPATYVTVAETGRKVGFITPLTHNFCESCNRVRLTCTGQLYMCLGQDDDADLRALLRQGVSDAELADALDEAISRKPKGHDFIIDREQNGPAVSRGVGRDSKPAPRRDVAQPRHRGGGDGVRTRDVRI